MLVHGYGIDATEWSLIQPALVDGGYRTIAYDHRAHGRSTIGSDGATSRALFDDLLGIAEHFDLHDAVIAGHSMGTFTTLGALAHPRLRARTRAAVLVSTETGHMLKGAPGARVLGPLARLGLMGAAGRSRWLGEQIAARAVGRGASAEIREATRLTLATVAGAAVPYIGVMQRETLEALLPALDVPLRLILGADDQLTPRWHSDLVVARAPDARLELLPGVGHMVNWEAPDVIVEAIRDAVASRIAS